MGMKSTPHAPYTHGQVAPLDNDIGLTRRPRHGLFRIVSVLRAHRSEPRMEVSGAPVGIVLCSRAHLWLTLGLVLLSGHSSAPRDATATFWVHVRWPTLSDDNMTGLPERCIVAVTVVPKSIRSHVNRAPSKNVHAEGS